MRKIAGLLLALALVLSACSATNNGPAAEQPKDGGGAANTSDAGKSNVNLTNLTDSGFPIVNDKITLKLMGPKYPIHGPWENMLIFTEYEKLTNIHLSFDTPASTDFQNKKNLAFASGELPDMFFGALLTPEEESRYGEQGLLIPLEDLIREHAPNIQAMFDTQPGVKQTVTSLDGHIYALPKVLGSPLPSTGTLWVNNLWLDRLGVASLPATTDELYDLLVRFRDEDPNGNGQPDDVPISGAEGVNSLEMALLSAFGHTQNRNGIDVIDDKVFYVPASDNYKEYLIYMNKLFREKLLDQDVFSQTAQQYTAKGKEGKIGMFVAALPDNVLPLTTVEEMLKVPVIPPMTSPVNQTKVYPNRDSIVKGAFAITKLNKHPEATIRWVDYFYSPEGSMFLTQGVENVSYRWLDEAKEYFEAIWPEGTNSSEFRGASITPQPSSQLPYVQNWTGKGKDPVSDYRLDNMNKYYVEAFRDSYPQVYFTEEEQKQLNVLLNDLNTYTSQMKAQFITGHESLDKWDNYMSTLEKMSYGQVTQIHQTAYDRWKNNR